MDAVPSTERAAKSANGRTNHLYHALRRAAPQQARTRTSSLRIAGDAFLPWSVWAYPGLLKWLHQLCAGRATPHTIRDWMRGKRRTPKWLWHLIAAEADRRIVALEHVRELAKKEAGL